MRRRLLLTAAAALALAAGLAVRRARLEPMLVQGGSMLPTLRPGQRVAVGPLRGAPARGELVVLRRPPGPHGRGELELVKRVVGLPGERLRLAGGRVEVDGRPLAEPYLAGPATLAGELEVTLGPDQYLVLGDHRAASTDGRAFGPLPAEALVGRVRFAYWPPRLRLR